MAREHPRYAAMAEDWPEYEFNEFPMVYYPGAKDQKRPYDAKGKRLRGIRVENEDELAAVRAGDKPAVEAADEPAEPAPTLTKPTGSSVDRFKTAEDEREELLAEAARLGVTFDKRWGAARLQDAIDTAKREREAPVV